MNKKEIIKQLSARSTTLLTNNKTTFKDIYNDFMNASPSTIAMIYHRYNDVTREYTYHEYNRLVISTAKKLSSLLTKINKGSTIALKLKNSPTWCIIFWGILMAGYVPLLIDAKLPVDNTQTLIKNGNAKAIITDDGEYFSTLHLTRNDIHAANEDNFFEAKWADEVIFCSSGTTGNIKLMVYNGFNMVNQLNAAIKMPDENLDIYYSQSLSPLRIIALIPFHHIFAFVAIFLWYSFYNASIVFTSFIDPNTIIEDIRKYKITHIYHVPLFYDVVTKNFINKLDDKNKALVDRLVNYNLKKISRKEAGLFIKYFGKKIREKIFGNQVRYCISGGGYLNERTSEIINGIGYPLYNGFGMTEVGVTSVELSKDILDRIKRSIGHPLHAVSYKIADNGELLIKSPFIHTREIIDGVNKKVSLDKDGYFLTGDIVKEINGRYYILGRMKDTIIANNGENVYPDEIESYFKKIKGINNLAVFSSNNRIILVVEGLSNLLEQINDINRQLPIHKQVNDIVFTNDPLPLSSSMKVKRFEVKKKFENKEYEVTKNKGKKDILSGYDINLKNKVVERLQNVFKKVLFIEKNVPVDGHWINDLHSDSMTYISLVAEIEKEFNYKFPLEQYGKLTCLSEFAKEILDSICK